ncbi:2-oxoadipate dioxygenase/decarboxylase family protein [Novosphingobium colocasiae]
MEGQIEDWIAQGLVQPIPMTYEDFLPVSAAGIFQSNLGGEKQRVYAGNASQAVFEAALGAPIVDPFALYEIGGGPRARSGHRRTGRHGDGLRRAVPQRPPCPSVSSVLQVLVTVRYLEIDIAQRDIDRLAEPALIDVFAEGVIGPAGERVP